MTVPDERTRAMVYTRAFLQDLRDPGVTPRVPKTVRDTANWLLRHYPEPYVVEIAHKAAPGWYGPLPKNLHWRADALDVLHPHQKPNTPSKPHSNAVNKRPKGKK